MSGINTGILTNTYPLSAERIKELEKYVLENREAFAYLNENSELCFMLPFEPGVIKDLAWNNAYMLNEEAGKLFKKVYNKDGLKSYFLKETLQKQNLDDAWQSSSNMITDLTNTTWHIPSGWSAPAGYGYFYITGAVTGSGLKNASLDPNNGYTASIGIGLTEVHKAYADFMIMYLPMYDGWFSFGSSVSFTLTITGGSDATNPDLISWLKTNGELQEKELITFTIDGVTYQAEEGMTWGEWVESEYNTIGCYIKDNGQVIYQLALYSEDYCSPKNGGCVPYENEIVLAGINWAGEDPGGGSN